MTQKTPEPIYYFDMTSQKKWAFDFCGETYYFTERTLAFYGFMIHVFMDFHGFGHDVFTAFGCPMHSTGMESTTAKLRPLDNGARESNEREITHVEKCRESCLNCYVSYHIKTCQNAQEKGLTWQHYPETKKALFATCEYFSTPFQSRKLETSNWIELKDKLLEDFHMWCGHKVDDPFPLDNPSYESCDIFYQWFLLYIHAKYEPLNPLAWEPLDGGNRQKRKQSMKREEENFSPELSQDLWNKILTLVTKRLPVASPQENSDNLRAGELSVKFDSPLNFFETINKKHKEVLSSVYNEVHKNMECVTEVCPKRIRRRIREIVKKMNAKIKEGLKVRIWSLVNLFQALSLVNKYFYFLVRQDFFFGSILYAFGQCKKKAVDHFPLCGKGCKTGFNSVFKPRVHYHIVMPFEKGKKGVTFGMNFSNAESKGVENLFQFHSFGSCYTQWYANCLRAEILYHDIEKSRGGHDAKRGETMNLLQRMKKRPILPDFNKMIESFIRKRGVDLIEESGKESFCRKRLKTSKE